MRKWEGQAGAALASKIVDRLKKGKSLNDLGLGTRENRIDLSGLPASPFPTSGRKQVGGLLVQHVSGLVEITGRSLVGLDLSAGHLNGWRLRDCEIVDCRLDRADCSEWILWNSSVKNCTFEQADLRHSMLGTFPEGGQVNWEDVSFAKADLRLSSAYGALLCRCDFSNALLKQAEFHECQLSQCRFAGRVEEVLFEGRELPRRAKPTEMDAVDFGDAFFDNVEFRGYSLSGVVLPNDEDVFRIERSTCVSQRVVDAISDDDSVAARTLRAALQNLLQGPQKASASLVFNRRDWRAWGGDELLQLAERLLKQAEAECP